MEPATPARCRWRNLLQLSLLMLRCRFNSNFLLIPAVNFNGIRAFALVLFLVRSACGQLMINEIMPANGDATWESVSNNQPSWVELYNPGKTTINLSGFYLSDDPDNLRKWRFPELVSILPRSHFLVWCSNQPGELFTGFSLSSKGETLILSGPTGVPIDRLSYPPQHLNISFGRITDGASSWSFFPTATPGDPNKGPYSSRVAGSPVFSLPAGPVSSGQAVAMTTTQSGSVIRFTEDGSEPDESSRLYTRPVALTRTTTFKARVFAAGFIPGPTVTHTYLLLDREMSLPVVSLSTRPSYLWDEYGGIYVEGSNGIPGNCADSRNWNQDWERHTVMEYFNTSGLREVVQDVDMRIGGACSRNLPQKSLVIKARAKYGSDNIMFGFFPNRTVGKTGGFILRNSGNDFNITQFRDAFAQSLAAGQMDVDFLDYRPVAVYLNGEYWGIMNIQEKADADYFRDNAGLEPEEMDLVEVIGFMRAVTGSTEAWSDYIGALQSMDRSTPEAYQFIDSRIDVQEYINYAVTEIYLANTDWPGNNVRFWRPHKANGKFRWVLWDLDFSFALIDGFSNATHPTLHFATDSSQEGWPNPAYSTLHLRLLLDNPLFRTRFASAMITAMEETFHPDRVSRMLDETAAGIVLEMPYHKARWGGTVQDWYWEVERMRRFAAERYVFMNTYVRDFFGYTKSNRLRVTSADASRGSFRVNGVWCNQATFSGTLTAGIPVRLEPYPSPGYQFSKWSVSRQDVDTLYLLANDAIWKYYDGGQLPANDWSSPGFPDQTWSSGPAELGYGDGDEKTVVSFGSDAESKHVTTWFRTSFTLDDTTGVSGLFGKLKYDDGVVIYLNGVEVFRANMPAGEITGQTLALAVAQEDKVHQVEFPAAWLKPGLNVLAAEVHQVSPASSDITFSLSVFGLRSGNLSDFESYDKFIELGDALSAEVVLHFIEDERKFSGLVINELSANSQDPEAPISDDWIELYNNGTDTLDLDGLMITDDTALPDLKVIRSARTALKLAPGGFLVLIADGRNMAGPLHLPFRLSASGETVGIFAASGQLVEPLDVFNFDRQAPDASWARIPDGIGNFVQTSAATPGGSNLLAVGLSENEEGFRIFPNPFTDTFRFSEAPEEWALFSILGQRITCVQDGQGWIHVPPLSPGIYVLQLRTAGRSHVVRIVRK